MNNKIYFSVMQGVLSSEGIPYLYTRIYACVRLEGDLHRLLTNLHDV